MTMRGEGPDYGPIIDGARWVDYIDRINKLKSRKTTHLRLYVDTKEVIIAKARQENMTVPNYMRKMVKDYLERSNRGEYL